MFFSNPNNKDNQEDTGKLEDSLTKKFSEKANLRNALSKKEKNLEEIKFNLDLLDFELKQTKSTHLETANDWLEAIERLNKKEKLVELRQERLTKEQGKKSSVIECFEIDLKEAKNEVNIEKNNVEKIQMQFNESVQKMYEQKTLFHTVTKEYNALSSEIVEQRKTLKIMEQEIYTLQKSIETLKRVGFTKSLR